MLLEKPCLPTIHLNKVTIKLNPTYINIQTKLMAPSTISIQTYSYRVNLYSSRIYYKREVVCVSQTKSVIHIWVSCAGTAPSRSVKFGRHQAWSNRTIVSKFGRDPTRGASLAGSRARGTLAIGLARGAKNGDIGRNRSDACSFPGLYLDDRWSQRHAVATDR